MRGAVGDLLRLSQPRLAQTHAAACRACRDPGVTVEIAPKSQVLSGGRAGGHGGRRAALGVGSNTQPLSFVVFKLQNSSPLSWSLMRSGTVKHATFGSE